LKLKILMLCLHPNSTVDRDRGFTLIELLVTLVLIALVMPPAMRGISLSMQLGGQSRKQIEAVALARTQLTELLITGDWEKGARSGDFGTDWPGYKWSVELSNWTESSNDSLRQLELTVTWPTRPNVTRKCALTTLVRLEVQ
jgi:prepilin-type N-terminal cleavage/methylation domain-containing protein